MIQIRMLASKTKINGRTYRSGEFVTLPDDLAKALTSSGSAQLASDHGSVSVESKLAFSTMIIPAQRRLERRAFDGSGLVMPILPVT